MSVELVLGCSMINKIGSVMSLRVVSCVLGCWRLVLQVFRNVEMFRQVFILASLEGCREKLLKENQEVVFLMLVLKIRIRISISMDNLQIGQVKVC